MHYNMIYGIQSKAIQIIIYLFTIQFFFKECLYTYTHAISHVDNHVAVQCCC